MKYSSHYLSWRIKASFLSISFCKFFNRVVSFHSTQSHYNYHYCHLVKCDSHVVPQAFKSVGALSKLVIFNHDATPFHKLPVSHCQLGRTTVCKSKGTTSLIPESQLLGLSFLDNSCYLVPYQSVSSQEDRIYMLLKQSEFNIGNSLNRYLKKDWTGKKEILKIKETITLLI